MSSHFAFPPLAPLTKKIIILLFAAFVLEVILQVWLGIPVFQLLALQPTQLGVHTMWQLVTYPLVEYPDAVFKILLSLLMLWWFLSPFEQRHGVRRTLQLSGVAILSASVPALAVGYATQDSGLFASSLLAGSDPIALAALAAFAITHRHSQILLFGVFAMKPVHIIALSVGISVLFFLVTRDVTTLAAHLGAIAGGYGFMHWLQRPPSRRTRTPRGAEASLHVLRGGKAEPPRWIN
jgi:membrane associated rhomboid family serine protease